MNLPWDPGLQGRPCRLCRPSDPRGPLVPVDKQTRKKSSLSWNLFQKSPPESVHLHRAVNKANLNQTVDNYIFRSAEKSNLRSWHNSACGLRELNEMTRMIRGRIYGFREFMWQINNKRWRWQKILRCTGIHTHTCAGAGVRRRWNMCSLNMVSHYVSIASDVSD